MAQPSDPSRPQLAPEDFFLELLADTLERLETSPRGQFLQAFFKSFAQADLTESQSLSTWQQVLSRQRELAESLGRRVSLRSALVDVFSSGSLLRLPVLVEYDEFKKLQVNAATDALTGLYNRRLFDEYSEKELTRARRYGETLALVLLDLHKLKELNDQHGHLEGDRALKLAAATLRSTIRASDFAFRIGGDEFALLLPQSDSDQASTLCRRIRAHFESEIAQQKIAVPVTLDFGIGVYPQDADQKERLLALADERLYELKKAGRATPRVVRLERPAPREGQPLAGQPAQRAERAPSFLTPSAPSVSAARAAQPERRKWERVSLGGTRAYAVIGEGAAPTASVIDLSAAGVALSLEDFPEWPSPFFAVLHVPILPPVRVSLRKIYTARTEGGRVRIGCAFVS